MLINHNHIHEHEQEHGNLHAHPGEIPAVFSHSAEIQLKINIEEDKFTFSLKLWMENLRDWSVENKYLIGHLKSFIEIDEDRSVWISCTGKDVNIKTSGLNNNIIETFKINMTIIIFGPDEPELQKTAIGFLNDNLQGKNIN